MTTLTGSKISLTSIREADTQDLYAAFLEIDEEGRFMTGTKQKVELEKVRSFAKRVEKTDSGKYFCIRENEKDRVIGELAITDIDESNKMANFRFSIYNQSNRDQGLGSEALDLGIGFAFDVLKLNRLELTVYEHNPRALHMYKKRGFHNEGLMREILYYNGVFHSGFIMSMLKSEYDRLKEE